jgi:hypothetical protein
MSALPSRLYDRHGFGRNVATFPGLSTRALTAVKRGEFSPDANVAQLGQRRSYAPGLPSRFTETARAFEPPDGAITRPDDRGPFLPLPVVTIETEAMVWSKADPWPSLDRQPSRGKSRPGWFKTRLSCPLVRKSKF